MENINFIVQHEKNDCEYVQNENGVKKCRLCNEVIKYSNSQRHLKCCKYFNKFIWKYSTGFECKLCPYSTILSSRKIPKIRHMYRHLQLQHEILTNEPIPSDHSTFGDVENNTGYLFLEYIGMYIFIVENGILLPKLFWPTVRKKILEKREKLLKFKAEGRKFTKNLR